MKNSKSLSQVLWNSADVLRSTMDANDYKEYLLGLVFYKYLSDRMLMRACDLLEVEVKNLDQAQEEYKKAYYDSDISEDLLYELQHGMSYSMKPELTYQALVQSIHNHTFQLSDLAQGLRDIEQSSEIFENLFDDIDLYSRKLGPNPQKQNETISEVMVKISEMNLAGEQDSDILGDAYEYLIGQFASDSGKKAGEFYTPQSVSKLMTQITMLGREDKRGFSVYDATMGSGSLLLNAQKFSKEPRSVRYFGQELNTSTYNLARMNMFLHNVPVENQNLHNGDTLDEDWPTEEPTNFDAVLMNPPYSAKWSSAQGFLEDPRFAPYGALPPKSRADFAFLIHGLYHLKTDGTMAIVLPHGVLFRGGREAQIRKVLLDNGNIDTIIGLPADLFYNTSIPTTILILKKGRTTRDVLFIDASEEFDRVKTQNILNDEHIKKIIETYKNREFVDKYAYLASYDEIVENDYNLNIPRYVDTFEEEEPIDVVELSKEIQDINTQIVETEKELLAMLDELQVTDESKDIIEATRAIFRGDL